MILSLLAVEAVFRAFRDLLTLDSGVTSVKSSVVVERSAPHLHLHLVSGWCVGVVCFWRHSMIGRVVLLSAAASMVMMYFCSVSNDSYAVNLNHF